MIPVGLFSKGTKGDRHLNLAQIPYLVCKSHAGAEQECDPKALSKKEAELIVAELELLILSGSFGWKTRRVQYMETDTWDQQHTEPLWDVFSTISKEAARTDYYMGLVILHCSCLPIFSFSSFTIKKCIKKTRGFCSPGVLFPGALLFPSPMQEGKAAQESRKIGTKK